MYARPTLCSPLAFSGMCAQHRGCRKSVLEWWLLKSKAEGWARWLIAESGQSMYGAGVAKVRDLGTCDLLMDAALWRTAVTL